MDKISNIKINYMLIEQILRVTGTYKILCDEHEFLDVIFKQAKTGEIDSLFQDDRAREVAFDIIGHITGLSSEYLSGEKRIILDIECTDEDVKLDDDTIECINLSKDNPFMHPSGEGHAYHGILYQELLKNPLHMNSEEIYIKVKNENTCDELEQDMDKALNDIDSLYSLKGLMTVMLLNMSNEIELIDKANVYKHTKWKCYIDLFEEPTEHGITYSPKFVTIKRGLIHDIIINIFGLGIPFTFRDYFNKEFKI